MAERLDDLIAGKSITGVQPIQFSALKTFDPPPEAIVGHTVKRVGRRGKFLSVELEEGRILTHLSQGGRIDVEKPSKATRPKNGVVRFSFDGPVGLFIKEFGTERKAGWWILKSGVNGPLDKLGPEANSDAFAGFIMESPDRRRIHTLLRDQRTVAGVGRGYSDDILHRARLSPYTALAALTEEERQSLLTAINAVLDEGLQAERKRKGGLPTKLGDHWIVHGRNGQPCPRCGEELRRVSYESHEVAYCPACQTDGKILADRRMSRLLR
ncbi:MAG: hypothetical protein H0W21_03700 [Actinobacteria bacterium]|nr:hypothetical protein [Actinomycetota bacterium]